MAEMSDDGGARAGRVRKKSAKVLEMEEFEEAEKKQFAKKAGPDSGKAAKAAAAVSPSPAAPPPAKKMKIKVEKAEGSPPVKTEKIDMSPVASVIKQEQVTPPPTKVSPQAVKSGQPASSVIKFLLSSPAVPTTPSVSTKAVTKASPPIPEGGTQISAAVKKSLKSKVMMDSEDEQPSDAAVVKQEELDVKPTLFTSPPPQLMTTTPIFSHPTPSSKPIDAAGSMDSLKMKLILSPKEKKPKATFEQMLESGNEATALALAKSVKKKKKKPVITVTPAKDPVSATPKPVSTPEPQSASQAMPNLAALVTSGKKKVPSKKKSKPLTPTTPVKTEELSPEETAAKLSTSPVDVEFEPNLVIAEDGDKVKPKKKLTGSGSKTKKKHSEDGSKAAAPPEGDIAALAAKVKVKGSKKKDDAEVLSKKRKRPPTAYTLYCNAHRAKLVAENPGIDFAQISRRLGEMWQTLTKKEKWCWRRKAKKMAGKGSTLISTGKANKTKPPAPAPTTPPAPPTVPGLPIAKPMVPHQGARIAKANVEESALSPIKGFGSEPVDVAAHLKLLGESLSNIGMRLQEHKGLIAVQGSMSVLLDSLMCSFGPLMCLTQQVPEMNGCSRETHAKTLDNIAYVMPGL